MESEGDKVGVEGVIWLGDVATGVTKGEGRIVDFLIGVEGCAADQVLSFFACAVFASIAGIAPSWRIDVCRSQNYKLVFCLKGNLYTRRRVTGGSWVINGYCGIVNNVSWKYMGIIKQYNLIPFSFFSKFYW